ncbi:hypothetical protein Btru_049619 [Bulinus truncatus]|nr:hypothetical protein Btru_049619 [Bulinus truncatus]
MEMVERYLLESYKSYQKCHLANSVRKNSLVKRTHAIEAERKLVCSRLEREERQLREHMKNIQNLKQMRACICKTAKERTLCAAAANSRISTSGAVESIDPYPVTFPRKTGSKKTIRQQCASVHGTKDHHRSSVEDSHQAPKDLQDHHPVRKISVAGSHHSLALSASWASGKWQGGAPGKSADLADDQQSVWVGEPEAIHSVRRARKSVAQQDLERLMRMREH